jgi:hypothetical protein
VRLAEGANVAKRGAANIELEELYAAEGLTACDSSETTVSTRARHVELLHIGMAATHLHRLPCAYRVQNTAFSMHKAHEAIVTRNNEEMAFESRDRSDGSGQASAKAEEANGPFIQAPTAEQAIERTADEGSAIGGRTFEVSDR